MRHLMIQILFNLWQRTTLTIGRALLLDCIVSHGASHRWYFGSANKMSHRNFRPAVNRIHGQKAISLPNACEFRDAHHANKRILIFFMNLFVCVCVWVSAGHHFTSSAAVPCNRSWFGCHEFLFFSLHSRALCVCVDVPRFVLFFFFFVLLGFASAFMTFDIYIYAMKFDQRILFTFWPQTKCQHREFSIRKAVKIPTIQTLNLRNLLYPTREEKKTHIDNSPHLCGSLSHNK